MMEKKPHKDKKHKQKVTDEAASSETSEFQEEPSGSSTSSSTSSEIEEKKKAKSKKPERNALAPVIPKPINTLNLEKKRKEEDDLLDKAEHRKKKKPRDKSSPSTSSKQSNQKQEGDLAKSDEVAISTRGKTWTSAEIGSLSSAILARESEKAALDRYFKDHPKSSRTRPAVKKFFGKLQSDLLDSLQQVTDVDKEAKGRLVMELVAPSKLVSAEGDEYLVYFKAHWDSIEVGYFERTVRWRLTKNYPNLDGYDVLPPRIGVFRFEIEEEYELVGKYETELVKGLKIKLKELKKVMLSEDGIAMS